MTTSPLGTCSTVPLVSLVSRQPPAVSERAITVTNAGVPSRMARPLRWQRSSAASWEMNGGRQRGTKLYAGSRPARHENSVFTTHSSGRPSAPVPQASSWPWMPPVTVELAGEEAAVVAPGRLETRGQLGVVAQEPDLALRAHRDLVGGHGDTHRLVEAVEVEGEPSLVGADGDQLTGLVGGDEQRHARVGEHARGRRRCG